MNLVSVPTIAVIGEQSSGKGSVLELVSDVALPRGTGAKNFVLIFALSNPVGAGEAVSQKRFCSQYKCFCLQRNLRLLLPSVKEPEVPFNGKYTICTMWNQGGFQKPMECLLPKMAFFGDMYEEKVRSYINIIDKLRSMGIDKEFSIPTIAVIGDQSSGKSSVLEMLSDVALPRGVVTKCPLELKLKKTKENKPWKGQISYRDYVKTLDHAEQVEDEIHKAQEILTENISISTELISLQIESSNAPDLTLIDLPGIVRVPIGNQPQDIAKTTKGLIKNYIQRKETIILVVIPCTVDIGTIEALQLAQEFDPEGERTMGVLTKPDLIDKGTEDDVIKILENKIVPLRKGYILVKCRGQHELNANTTMPAALEEELTFLSNSQIFRPLLDKGFASFTHLSNKLTSELIRQITNWLPIIEEALRDKIIDITNQLEELGSNIPEEAEAKKLFLNSKILTYCEELNNLVMGDYKKEYDDDKKICDFSRKLFSVWYNKMEMEKVRLNEEALPKVKYHDQHSQGRELPGFTKYRIFESIIREQIQKLLAPSLHMMKELADKVQTTYNRMGFEHFNLYPNLMEESKALIAQIRQKQEQDAEKMLKMHFNMEDMVYAPDAMHSNKLVQMHLRSEKSTHRSSSPGSTNLEMAAHLQAYYQIVIDRLIQIVPMVTKYHLLQEFANQVKLKMTQTFVNGADADELLDEDQGIANKRKRFKDSLDQLNKARSVLMANKINRM
ncbi:interferon-induced GTP-binding protein Mx-like isoform X2 [Heterodontus francisci]|uniref:interferon-induced GTP-binding protein Mx-like isoform X2 n=1 Tax=Heterodontus francisci TaxID=7792 RepID=UPI00355C39E8